MDILDTFFNVPVLVRTFRMLMWGLWVTIKIGVGQHRRWASCSGSRWRCVRLYAPRPSCRAGPGLHQHHAVDPAPGAADHHLLRAAVPRGQALALHVVGVRALAWSRRPTRPRSSEPGSRPSRKGQFEASGALGLGSPPHDGGRDPAAGDPHRDPAADQQLHQRPQGHGARLGRGHAGPAQAGDPGAGAWRPTRAPDRGRDHLHRAALADGQHGVAPRAPLRPGGR